MVQDLGSVNFSFVISGFFFLGFSFFVFPPERLAPVKAIILPRLTYVCQIRKRPTLLDWGWPWRSTDCLSHVSVVGVRIFSLGF